MFDKPDLIIKSYFFEIKNNFQRSGKFEAYFWLLLYFEINNIFLITPLQNLLSTNLIKLYK